MRSKKFHLLVTAGPTREMLDPVRFLSNVSTGLMGYQIARRAKRMNFQVTLVSGPTALRAPRGVHFISVLSAEEMRRAVLKCWPQADALIMTAAVCDYTPVHFSKSKIKRVRQKSVPFKRTPDILAQVGRRKGKRVVVGFALETEAVEKNASAKLRRKNLDFIVANWYHKGNNPFGDQRATVILMGKNGFKKVFPKMNKTKLAASLLRELKQRLDTKKG